MKYKLFLYPLLCIFNSFDLKCVHIETRAIQNENNLKTFCITCRTTYQMARWRL